MAGTCSLYSLSAEKPSLPARLLMATTGKTTLISVLETPRVLVLACPTGVAVELDELWTSAAPATPEPPGVPDGAKASQTTRPTTMATTMTAVRICMARGRRRRRRHDRPIGAAGFHIARCPSAPALASMVTLLRFDRCGLDRLPQAGPTP